MPPIATPKDYSRLLALICVLLPAPALAQNIAPANDGTGTAINNNGQQFDITGGTASGNGANLFHSFQQFNLDAGQTANFISAPSIQNILGRVTGGNASIINGLIQVTGGNSNLYLMNPAGVLFGPNASLNVPASFSVTTATGIGFGNNWFHAIGTNDYHNLVGTPSGYRFVARPGKNSDSDVALAERPEEDVSQPGAIVNTGNLELSPGQDLTLTGGTVINTGDLSTAGGNVTIAAVEGGDLVRISQPGHVLNLEISRLDPEHRKTGILPVSELPALLTEGNFNSNATGLTVDENGIVVLTGPGATVAEGVAIASGNIDVSSTQQGGEVNILGSRVGILNANINADGINGGGEVFIGGDFQGSDRLPASQQTVVNNSIISASSLQNGDGGEVIIWSDGTTDFEGNISATGGVISGEGGFVEVSGKEQLFVDGNIDVGAANGATGTILFDPRNIVIDRIEENSENLETETPADPFAEDENGDVTISATQLEALEGEITLQADSDITVNEEINTSESVEFNAGRSININADINTSTGNGNISLLGNDDGANAANRSEGAANINQRENTTINAGAGNITLRLGNLGRVGEINVENLTTTGRVLINANGGNIGRVSSNSLITAGNANFLTSDLGSIGLTNAPLRLDVTNLEAEAGTGGVFINATSDVNIGGTNPNLRGILSEGEVGLNVGGDVTVSERIRAGGNINVAASDSINVNANINSASGNGNIALRANDESVGVASGGGRASISQLEGTNINAGSGDIDLEFGSLGNSEDIGLANLTTTGAVRVNASGGNILRVGEDGLIEAGSAAFETIGEGGIGTAEVPLRLDVGNLEALGGSGGAFFDALTGVTVGGVRDELTGIVTIGGGDVELSAGGRVVVSEGISTTAGGNIGLSAGGNMTVSQEISTDGGGDVDLSAGGNMTVEADISTSVNSGDAGNLTLDSGGTINIAAATLSSTADESAGGNVRLEAAGDIETGNIDSSANTSGGAINITSSEGGINTTGGTLRSGRYSKETGGDVTLIAVGEINTGNIDSLGSTSGGAINITSSEAGINTTGGTLRSGRYLTITGGNVTLSAVGEINTGNIESDGSTSGGAINITSSEAGINTAGGRLSSGRRYSGTGGDVTLTAVGEINTGDIYSFGGTSAGAINITSSEAGINTTGGQLSSESNSGTGGDVTLTAVGEINTGYVNSFGSTSGGAINITSSEAGINTTGGRLTAGSYSDTGGDVTLTAVGDINTGYIYSSGETTGGAINITSSSGGINTNNLNTFSGYGTAGDIQLQAENNISTSINASGSQQGGNITLTSNTGNVFTGELNIASPYGSNGTIAIDANTGSIEVGAIVNLTIEEGGSDNPFNNNDSENTTADADTVNGQTGEVSLQAHNDITINEVIETAEVSSLELTAGRNININADIDTSAGNGNITLEANSQRANPDLRETGPGNVNMAAGTTLNAGSGEIVITLGFGEIGEVGDINLANLTTTGTVTVNASGGDILRVGENSLVTAAGAVFVTSGSGSIGRLETPLRLDADNLEATAGSGGAFFDVLTGITVGGVRDALTGIRTEGGDLELKAAGDINVTEDINSSVNSGDAGNITLDSDGGIEITAATVNSRAREGSGGDVTLTAVGEINTGNIDSYSSTTSSGSINITSSEAGINTTGGSLTAGRYSETGGDVTLTAVGEINTGYIGSSGIASSGSINITSSEAGINTTGGRLSFGDRYSETGGDVTLTAVGEINTGSIQSYGRTSSGAINITSSESSINIGYGGLRSGSSYGTGGDVTLTAVGEINTGNIYSYGSTVAGNINITSSAAGINTAGLSSSSYSTETGGNVTLTAVGEINTGDIYSDGSTTGGTISITSSQGSINTNNLNTSSTYGTAGDIQLQAENNISTSINASGSQEGGNITLTSNTGNVFTEELNTTSANGNNGEITIDANTGSIEVGTINLTIEEGGPNNPFNNNDSENTTADADTVNGQTGEVSLQAHNDITINEVIETAEVSSLELTAGRNININADIDTSAGNGNITLEANSQRANPELRETGPGNVNMAAGTTLNAGSGEIVITLGFGEIGEVGDINLANLTTTGKITVDANGGDILRVGENSLVTAGGAAFVTSGSGSIGRLETPLRLDADNLEATAGSGGAFFDVLTGITVGGVRDALTGIRTEGGDLELKTPGDINVTEDINSSVNSGDAGNITLDSDGGIEITAATLNSSAYSGTGGDVTLTAVGEINTDEIYSGGGTTGGAINITSSEGGINTTGGELRSGRFLTGTGGDVTLTAVGDINTGEISSYGGTSGGAIDITSSEGGINATGEGLRASSYSGTGGDVTLTAVGEINTGNIYSYGSTSGGGINITSSEAGINTTGGRLRSGTYLFSYIETGGDVTLTAVGEINTGEINSSGLTTSGSINITSSEAGINTTGGTLSSSSSSGSGGDVTLTAVGEINTGDIYSNGSIESGSINITSSEAGINTTRGNLDSSASYGTAGNVTLEAARSILAGNINAGGGQESGDIVIESRFGDVDTSGGQLDVNSENGIDGNLNIQAFTGSISVGDIDGTRNLTVAPGGEDDPFGNNEPGRTGILPVSSIASDADKINSRSGEVTLQAHNDITINEAIESSEISNLQIGAGRNLNVNADIDTSGGNGNIVLKANDEGADARYRLPGRGSVTMAPGTALNAGRGNISIVLGNFGENSANIGNITLGNLNTTGSVTVSAGGGNIFRASPNSLVTAGSAFFQTSGSGGIGAPRERLRVRVDDLGAIAGGGGAFFNSPTQGLTITGITTNGGGDVAVRANGDITVTALISTATTSGDAGDITLRTSGNVARPGKDSEAMLPLRRAPEIDTSAVSLDASSSKEDNGGTVTLEAEGNITTGAISTVARPNFEIGNDNSNGRGGDILLNAGGNIDTTAGPIDSSAFSQFGDGGNVTFRGDGNITTSDLDSYASLDGNDGNINLRSQRGDIDTSGGSINSSFRDGDGNGGNIRLTTVESGDITTGDIDASAKFSGGDRGGNIILNSGGNIDTTAGFLESSAGSNTGSGGNISLNANGDINTGDIRTFASGSGQGGDVTIEAGGNVDTSSGSILSASVEGNTGNITVSAGGDVSTGDIDLASGFTIEKTFDFETGEEIIVIVEVDPVSGVAGDIDIASTNGSIDTSAGVLDSRSPDDSGNINLSASGDITTGEINASALNQSQPTQGGDIDITSSEGDINANGAIETFSEIGTAGNVTLDAAGTANTTDILSDGDERGGNISITSDSENTINVRGRLDTFSELGTAGDITLEATGSVNTEDIRTFGLTESGDITITSDNNNVNTGAITTQAPGGDSGNIRVNGENVATGNLRSLAQDSAGGIRVQATDGSIRTEDIEVRSEEGTAGPVEVEATEDVETGDIEVTAGEGDAEIDISAGGDITGGDQTATAENGNASIDNEAGGDINLRDQIATATGGDASIDNEAGGNINLRDQIATATGGDASINNEAGGNINVGDQTAVAEGGNASINNEAGGNITAGDQTAVAEGGNASINNEAGGNITAGDQTAIAEGGNASINNEAGGNITVGDQTAISFGGDATITNIAEGNITTGDQTALSEGGNAIITNEGGGNLTTGDQTPIAPDGINQVTNNAGGTVNTGELTEGGSDITPFLNNNPVLLVENDIAPPPGNLNISPVTTTPTPPLPTPVLTTPIPIPPLPTPALPGLPIPTPESLPPLPELPIPESLSGLPELPIAIPETLSGLPELPIAIPGSLSGLPELPIAIPGSLSGLPETSPTAIANNPSIQNAVTDITNPAASNPESGSSITNDTSDTQQILQALNALNTSPMTVSANTQTLTLLEESRNQEFADYLGLDLSFDASAIKNVREVLADMAEQTDKNSAVVYISLYAEEIQLILYTAEGEPILKTIPGVKREEVIETVRDLRDKIVTSLRFRNLKTYLSPAQQLYQWLIAPISAELEAANIDTLLFSMDEGLRSLPVAALHDGEQFLIEQYSLSMIPSISLIDSRYSSVKETTVLAMGASEFTELEPLPAVPVELEHITTELWQGDALIDEEFTVSNLIAQRQEQTYPIIHLATHGEFKPGDVGNSYIQFWGEEKLTLDRVRELGLDKPTVELLVLSACRTAVGDRNAELGFAGLAVAAGVKSAVASLWYVSDEGTLGLMTEFYSHLDDVTIKAEALRQAQLAMLRGEVEVTEGELRGSSRGVVSLPPSLANIENNNLSHPYYWSGFTTIGSPW